MESERIMRELTFINIGSVFERTRKSMWSTSLIGELFDVDVDFQVSTWHEVIRDDYLFPEVSGDVVVKFHHHYPDQTLTDYMKKEYGQTHLRPGTRYTEAFCSLVDRIERKIKEQIGNVVYVNSPSAIKQLRDKREMSRMLIESGIPHPRVIENPTVDAILKELDEGKPMCLKPIGGSCGRGITRVQKANEGYEVKTTWEASDKFEPVEKSHMEILTNENFEQFLAKYVNFGCLVQEWVEPLTGMYGGEGYIFDVREVVLYPDIYGRPVTEVVRRAPPDQVTTNVAMHHMPTGYNFLKDNLGSEGIRKSRELAMEAARIFDNLNESGVDILWSNERFPFVIELNAFPGHVAASYSGVDFPLLEVLGMLESLEYDVKIDLRKLCFENTIQTLYET